MVALLGALIGGGASIAGSLIGADATSDAAEKNWQINLLNYYQREKERRESIRQYQENQANTKLGQTNARGDRTHFVEGVGWVSDLSQSSQDLDRAQLAEQMAVLLKDKPQQREVAERNMGRQREEDFVAQGFLDELAHTEREDPNAIRLMLQQAMSRGVNEAFDKQGNQAMKTAVRTGASNSGNILASLGRARSDALSKAAQDALLKSGDIARQHFDQDRAGAAQLYNMFAERAGRMPNVSYQPQNVTAGSDNALSTLASSLGVDSRALAEAFARKGGTVDYVQPDLGMANALASIGGVFGGISNKFDQSQRRDQENENFMNYLRKGRGSY